MNVQHCFCTPTKTDLFTYLNFWRFKRNLYKKLFTFTDISSSPLWHFESIMTFCLLEIFLGTLYFVRIWQIERIWIWIFWIWIWMNICIVFFVIVFHVFFLCEIAGRIISLVQFWTQKHLDHVYFYLFVATFRTKAALLVSSIYSTHLVMNTTKLSSVWMVLWRDGLFLYVLLCLMFAAFPDQIVSCDM